MNKPRRTRNQLPLPRPRNEWVAGGSLSFEDAMALDDDDDPRKVRALANERLWARHEARNKTKAKRAKRELNASAGAPKAPDVADLDLPEAYYNEAAGKPYFVKASDDEYIGINKEDMGTRLELAGLSATRDGAPSAVSEKLIEIQNDQYVRYAGPLAGWPAGRYDVAGKKILVTESPVILEPTYGRNMVVRDYIGRLVGPSQAIYVHAWLKLGYEALKARNLRRAPVLCIIGERDQGKSFLIQAIIVPLLGGRQAQPQQFMTGATSFNLDLAGSEVLVLDDPGSDDHYATRKRFGDAIKAFTGDQAPRCHGKGQNALILTPFWRVVVTMNDELEDLQVLPPMTGAMHDKIIILKTVGRAVDRRTASTVDFASYAEMIAGGLSDYLGWLERWTIPTELVSDRWGMRACQHAEVLAQIHSLGPEERLYDFIQMEIVAGLEGDMALGSTELYLALTNSMSDVAMEARYLLRSPGSLGKYMGRLCKRYPREFREAGKMPGRGNATRYIILARPKKG